MSRSLFCLLACSLMCVGCGLTTAQRAEIVREAGDFAADKAAKIAFERGLKAGLSEDAAREVSGIAADKARRLAEKAAEKSIPEKESQSSGKIWAILGQILVTGLQLATGVRRT